MKNILFLLFLINNALAQNPSPEQLKKVAFSTAWLRLLHYNIAGKKYESRLDGKDFFFASDGKTNPLSELQASLIGLGSDKPIGRMKLKAQCAFPERKRFLEETFQIKYPKVDCPLLDDFFKSFHGPVGLSLVFSAAYPNNPASMFGHTFLKFRSNRKSDLLDRSISFAAYTPKDVNMLSFMYKGVIGGYPGLWSIDPYYKKVNEYINSESRDLWEYELNVTENEAKRIAAHLWELEVSSYFDYFFFDENCAYQILKAIEAIKIDWNITEHNIYVIPSETIKNVAWQEGIVKNYFFRPSLFHQIQIKMAALNEKEKNELIAMLNRKEVEGPNSKVLSATLTGILYEKAKKKDQWSKSDQAWEEQILTLTANQKAEADSGNIPQSFLDSKPDLGHDPYAIYFSLLNLENTRDKSLQATQFKIRSAYHDLMARDLGFAPFSEIEFPWIDVQVQSNGKTLLNEIGGFHTTSLFPLSRLENRRSWRVKLFMQRETLDPCLNCFRPVLETGLGATLGSEKMRLYGLGLIVADFHPELNLGYRLQPTVEVGYIIKTKDFMKTKFLYRHLYNPRDEYNTDEYELSSAYYPARNHEIRLSGKSRRSTFFVDNFESTGSLQYIKYFR